MVSMVRENRRLVKRFATALAVWILAFSAIIPSLDRELVGSGVWIESEHDEGCAPHHDHTICIQFGKQDWTTDSSLQLRVFQPAAREASRTVSNVLLEFLRLIPTHSRAPPHTA
jgi:hypothetical protein